MVRELDGHDTLIGNLCSHACLGNLSGHACSRNFSGHACLGNLSGHVCVGHTCMANLCSLVCCAWRFCVARLETTHFSSYDRFLFTVLYATDTAVE